MMRSCRMVGETETGYVWDRMLLRLLHPWPLAIKSGRDQ